MLHMYRTSVHWFILLCLLTCERWSSIYLSAPVTYFFSNCCRSIFVYGPFSAMLFSCLLHPEITICWPNGSSMLVQRRRRWPSIELTLGRFPLFTGSSLQQGHVYHAIVHGSRHQWRDQHFPPPPLQSQSISLINMINATISICILRVLSWNLTVHTVLCLIFQARCYFLYIT